MELFTSINRLLKKLALAVSHWGAAQSSAPTQRQSLALPAATTSVPVSVADAVAELSKPTGNENFDYIREMTIDCLQKGYVYAVRTPDGFRFPLTEAGQNYVKKMLGHDH
jgi:hypothetical protein